MTTSLPNPASARKIGRGFYMIMAAQFFSALADNALLVAAIRLMRDNGFPHHLEPLLKLFFSISYVLLAAHAGSFADAYNKRNVMFVSNAMKLGGCMLLLFLPSAQSFQFMPLIIIIMVGYGLVGLSAASYSPAKYGIVTELIPHQKLVIANSWIEGLTVGGIILGTVVGGVLIDERVYHTLLALPIFQGTMIDSSPEIAMAVISLFYIVAAILNLYVPKTGVKMVPFPRKPAVLMKGFFSNVNSLCRDPLGQISLAVTTLFWGTGAALQFLVLRWGQINMGLPLEQAAYLQALVGVGIFGGVAFAVKVKLENAPRILPVGVALGVVVAPMVFVYDLYLGVPMALLFGVLSGYFIVPMNALLQHRGHKLMGAGNSIAVQNFCENISIVLAMAALFLLEMLKVPFPVIVLLFCAAIVSCMLMVMWLYRYNLRTKPEVMHELYEVARKSNH